MKQNNIKKIVLSCISIISPYLLLAQQAEPAAAIPDPEWDLNWILIVLAFFLLLPLYVMGKAYLFAFKNNLDKEKMGSDSAKKVGIIIALLCLSQISEAKTIEASIFSSNWLAWFLAGVILLETILIAFFSMQTIKNLKSKTAATGEENQSALTRIWNKINSFKPLSQEGEIDTGHNYDGIRELDNVTPPWFITAFVMTILFAAVYLYRYHIAKTAPLQGEEFAIEMAEAEQAKSKLLGKNADVIDENTVVMLGAADIEDGKKIFTQICAACHAPHGGSMAGGVGPNLTDEYWIHGGSIKDIFKSIKYGWPEKGMISWQNNFSSKQIAQLASFVKSIKGSNPAGAKEPQGELYKEEGSTATTAEVKDTANINK